MVANRIKTRSWGTKSQRKSIPGETGLSKDPEARKSLVHLGNERNTGSQC